MEELTLAAHEEHRTTEVVATPTVLLIEDDPGLSQVVGGLLTEAGYRPVTIADHAQIAAAVERWRPRCVILDGALLPTGQGRSWNDAIEIRRAHPGLPVVMFTADTAALAEARAGTSGRSRAAGFAGVVGKPFAVEEFLATVRGAVDGFPEVASPAIGEAERALFFGTVVHELRQPLTAISIQIQLARRLARDPERQGVVLDRAFVQVARMERLITELLTQSRLEAPELPLEIVTFDLCAVVADVVAQHEHGDSAQIALELATHDLRVRGDPFRVAQVVGNLVSNALKYGLPGSRIVASLSVVGREARFRIEDHGVGIAANERDRIFEPYYRSTRTRSASGAGLGLYISRRLAERHGGRLWLEASTEGGSAFVLALPIAADQ
jgi:signal transduction histidine kinase